jgi:hypothetical protein
MTIQKILQMNYYKTYIKRMKEMKKLKIKRNKKIGKIKSIKLQNQKTLLYKKQKKDY